MGALRLLSPGRGAVTLAAAAGLMLLAAARPLGSWEQHPHRQINYEATKLFFARLSGGESDKYRLGPISDEGRSALHRGIAVSSSTMFVKPALGLAEDYQIAEARHSMGAWITLGGDWADEPHLYASVRHFYDPFKVAGVAYLTDQFWAHGKYDNPDIDQLSWAMNHPDNPFSLLQGLTAYKLALETPDGPVAPALAASHFKTNISIVPKDAADQRSVYLARAYRSLGEVMHMIGDMTQPAHVRNDSHPMDEPVETRTYSSDVRRAAKNLLVDTEIRPYLASAGGTLQAPRELAHRLAVFTNRNFYSMDTICDRASGVEPGNEMPPNASPQFSDLKPRTVKVDSFGFKRNVTRYDASIAGQDVPMIQERLAFHIFAADHSVTHGSAFETFARLHGAYTGRIGPYHVPTAFAREQAAVLLPVAIHACADLMDLFFPTLELTAEYEEEDMAEADEPRCHTVTIEPTMVHHRDRDPAWKAFGLSVEYSGPGVLVISEAGKERARRRLAFAKGKLEGYENAAGEMVEGPLKVYVATGREGLAGEEAFYAFAHGQQLHLEIDAGSRHFESAPYEIEPELVVMPRHSVGPPGATFDLEAYARPEGVYRYEWAMEGESDVFVDEGNTSAIAPVLEKVGEFYVTVKLFHLDGTLLDSDRVTVEITEEETTKPKGGGYWAMTEVVTEARDFNNPGSLDPIARNQAKYYCGDNFTSSASLDRSSARVTYRGTLREMHGGGTETVNLAAFWDDPGDLIRPGPITLGLRLNESAHSTLFQDDSRDYGGSLGFWVGGEGGEYSYYWALGGGGGPGGPAAKPDHSCRIEMLHGKEPFADSCTATPVIPEGEDTDSGLIYHVHVHSYVGETELKIKYRWQPTPN